MGHVLADLGRTRDAVAALHTLLDENGLALSGLNLSPVSSPTQRTLCDQVSSLREQMEFALEMGLDAVSVSAGPRDGQSIEKLVLCLDAILPSAIDAGLVVNLINVRGSRIENLDDLRFVMLKVKQDNLRVVVDCGQFHDAAVNPRDVLAEFGDRTSIVRLGDRRGRRQVALGSGETNVPAILEDLDRLRFDGWLVMEPPAGGATQVVRHYRRALQYLRSVTAG